MDNRKSDRREIAERRETDRSEAQERRVLLDRRNFVIRSFTGVGALTAVAACGGGGGDEFETPELVAERNSRSGPHPNSTNPTPAPTLAPTPAPTLAPTPAPTLEPTLEPTPAPSAAPTQPMAGNARQFQTWDGGSGPSRDHWSQKLQLPWVNPGRGDWRDAQLTLQGSVPYAAGTVALGRIDLAVTSLVNRWVSNKANRGFYLRSGQTWAFKFAGRTHGVLSERPKLFVVTQTGATLVIECTHSAMWSASTYQGSDGRNVFSVSRDGYFAALQFDTSALAESVQSATLSLTCVALTYSGALEVFELNPPVFRDGAGTSAVRTGLAHEFAFDRGLDAHASVVFSGDFSDLSKARWQQGGVVAGTTQVLDAATGSTCLRGLIPQGELSGCTLERNVVSGMSAGGVPNKVETELYGRYYLYLEEDWGSEIDENKMPGWDARMGWWSGSGYWQSTTGNGGSRPTGLKVRNTTANRWEYEGASMRGHGGKRLLDGNPYDDLVWVGNYLYHLDQATNYGEAIKWTGVALGRGRWYCIEQYIKMNSIAGPFDAIGNGVAANDGVYRAWVDGVQAYERLNLRWRRHPEMGIQGFWLNWYHGGTAPAPRTMHLRMDSVVIARAYIGPRNETR